MRPRILLSSSKGSCDSYEQAILQSGGIPSAFYCPPLDTGYDGLILCGGGDIDPIHFDQANCGSQNIDPERDAAELALVWAYLSAGKPILGICRGCQVVNVAMGGSLIQDLPDNLRPFHTSGGEEGLIHPVRAAEGSFFAQTYGPHFMVNSYHHQAVSALGEGLYPTVWSEGGVVEAMEHEQLPVLCVQFHTERMAFGLRKSDTVDGEAVFRWLMERCSAAAERR